MMEKIIVLSLVVIYFFIFIVAVTAMLTAVVREFFRRWRRNSKTKQLKKLIRPWYPEIDSLPEEEAVELGLAFARWTGTKFDVFYYPL
jgi:hypothetical protein